MVSVSGEAIFNYMVWRRYSFTWKVDVSKLIYYTKGKFHIFIIIVLDYDVEYPNNVSKTYTIKALKCTHN